MSDSEPESVVTHLAEKCGREWPMIKKADLDARAERAKRAADLSGAGLIPVDTSLVVFGSLARGEWTQGSDLDWTLLVDGQVDVQHSEIARLIAEQVARDSKAPGPTGVFGGLTFSHEIVHFIGGDDDTNTNTTRRILLLLESKSLTEDAVRQRVLRALLARYIGEDLFYHKPENFLVPRFLLNDYVRYWRTMAVDSAQKRQGRVERWALRNIKLRLSRKLIFAAGLWACLCCRLHPSDDLKNSRVQTDRDAILHDMTEFLLGFSDKSPLETLAGAFMTYEAFSAAIEFFDAYEDFLQILNDSDLRSKLERLKFSEAMSEPVFGRAKTDATNLQHALTKLFFDTNKDLTLGAQSHGVF